MSIPTLSRRRFLGNAGLLGLAGLGALSAGMDQAAEDRAQNEFVINGGLVRLPARGTLYVASDFHTRYRDFQRWLETTDLVARLKAEQHTYGLILGDAADIKPLDPHAEKDGDSRIIDRIREIQHAAGPAGRKLIFILGNHEAEVVRIYGLLKSEFGLTDRNRMHLVNTLYDSADGDHYRQFNFLERITDEQFLYLKTLPAAVLCANGLVAVHAGPSRSLLELGDLVRRRPRVIDELVWERPAEVEQTGYGSEDLLRFLKLLGDAGVLLVGHTPLSLLPPSWLRDGVGVFAERQLILATSYGSEPGLKSHLVLDLSRRYRAVTDLRAGQEIQRLEDRVGCAVPTFLSRRLVAVSGAAGVCAPA